MRFGNYCEIQTPPGKPHYEMIWEIMRQIEHAVAPALMSTRSSTITSFEVFDLC